MLLLRGCDLLAFDRGGDRDSTPTAGGAAEFTAAEEQEAVPDSPGFRTCLSRFTAR